MSTPLLATLLLAGCGLVIDADEHDARLDGDGDGYVSAQHGGDDCDDTDSAINPGQVEICNGVDDDCDGDVDLDAADASTWLIDDDGDGFGRPDTTLDACTQPEGYVSSAEPRPDCNDGDATINPGAAEVCDEEDNDCDGDVDEGLTGTYYEDADEDGYGDPDTEVSGCPQEGTWVEVAGDCDDGDAAISPDAAEICGNAVDEDCDDEAQTCPLIELDDADIKAPGANEGDAYGYRVSTLDGKVAISGPDAHGGAGGAWLHTEPGDSQLDASRASLEILGESSGDAWGASLALSDDLLGEGYLSLVVGSPAHEGRGAVAVFQATPGSELDVLDADAFIYGTDKNEDLGFAVAAVGDVTGDSVADLLIGDPSHVDPYDELFYGSAWVVQGPLSGLIEVTDGFWLAGVQYASLTGRSVAGAGDVDGDGVGDIMVGAPQSGEELTGEVYLVLGPIGGDLELDSANAVITSPERYELLGAPLAGGDVDGDGHSDLVIGAVGLNRSSLSSGELGFTYVFTGLDTALPDSIEDASAKIEQLERYDAADDYDEGLGLDASADFNGDGRMDILIGYPGPTDPPDAIGTTYLVHGGVEGTVSLSLAQASFVSSGPGDSAGRSVAADDIDGDSDPDVLIGAPGPTGAPGRVYGVLGGSW